MDSNNFRKKILIFAKSFLPDYTPESIRTASLIKYFIKDGWNIYLFTYTKGEILEPNYDYLNSVKIYRIPKLFYKGIPYFSKILNYIFQIYKASVKINQIIREENIEMMFISIPQLQPLLIGASTKYFNRNISLIEEIRDIYSFSELTTSSRFKSFALTKIEGHCIRYVDKFIFVTPIIKSEYENKFSDKNERLKNGTVVYNAFDSENNASDSRRYNISDGTVKTTFLYTGKIYGSRNPIEFILAMGKLLNEQNNLKHILFKIAGEISKDNLLRMNEIISKYNLKNNVVILGSMPHRECISLQQETDYNILFTHKSGSHYAIPSKIFEYAAAGKPILAITEDNLVIDIIEKYKLGYCVTHQTEEIYLLLKKILNDKYQISNQISLPEIFTRRYQFNKIKQILLNN